ncbi:hypothetical protein KAR91_22120 [Candidatus Pacearchaeota archaeon]|nr:hypothetical protein [Candidatus Pacearchaeota archaeon]
MSKKTEDESDFVIIGDVVDALINAIPEPIILPFNQPYVDFCNEERERQQRRKGSHEAS